ncbi:MAG: glycine cleavage system aminomethyltransferase GcvT [Armatimonadetes bacterium]|nr:glycine cleavage system aminomethyltransferase GcvT [Armatimonadota bacterium]
MESELKQTPLHDRHVALGARMVGFGGWSMPVQYAGIVAEHRGARAAAGLFDVSHMGEFIVEGPGALGLLQHALTNDYASLAVGRARYSLMCAEDGGIIDDLIVSREGEDRYLIVVNAGNIDGDFAWLSSLAGDDVTLTNVSDEWALLAVQGPRSADILAGLLSDGDATAVRALRYYAIHRCPLLGVPVVISRTGYTGDLGFEVFVPADSAVTVWDGLLAGGAAQGLVPVGLGARDTLRLEAGFCLHGHDISPARNPIEANLGRFVKFDKPAFVGRDALAAVSDAGCAERLVGLSVTERGVVRDGCAVVHDGQPVGLVTSGTYSPLLERSIALAYVRADLTEVGTALAVDVRGRALPCMVSALPFYKPGT